MSLLEERIRRSSKNRPTPGTTAPKATQPQTVQKATGLCGQINSSIHIDLVPVNFDDILNEPVPLPRYK